MDVNKLNEVVRLHGLWLSDHPGGKRADLRGANLQGADLQDANLQRANLQRANLQGADLQDANLQGANLRDADLQDAGLRGAALRGVDLQRADLQRADLQGADLQGADLRLADLRCADLQRADLRCATIREFKIVSLVARQTRSDGCEALLFRTQCGHVVRFGCRTMTIPQYRAHAAENYAGTEKYTETIAMLDQLQKQLEDLK